jgi:ATP-dependent Zn protease
VQSWHDRDAARAAQSGELASDRHCYREIGGAGCRCVGFRDSGEIAVIASPSSGGGSLLRSLLLIVVLIFMGLALLYAYRAQAPAVQTVSYSQAIQEINSGQVRKVTITGNRATLELANAEKQQTIVPQPSAAFEKTLSVYNAANPSRTVVVEFQSDSPGFPVILSILLSLLPVLLLGAFFLYMFSRMRPR